MAGVVVAIVRIVAISVIDSDPATKPPEVISVAKAPEVISVAKAMEAPTEAVAAVESGSPAKTAAMKAATAVEASATAVETPATAMEPTAPAILYYPGHRQVPAALRALIDMIRTTRGWTPAKGLVENPFTADRAS